MTLYFQIESETAASEETLFNASQRISELEKNVEELKRKAAQNSGEAEYIEKVVYTVKQRAEDIKRVSKSLYLHSRLIKEQLVSSLPSLELIRDTGLT